MLPRVHQSAFKSSGLGKAAGVTWSCSGVPQRRPSRLKLSHLRSTGPVSSPELRGRCRHERVWGKKRCTKTSTSGNTPPPPFLLLSRWQRGCTCSAGQQHMEACLGARLSGRNMKRRLRAQACPSPLCLLLRNITSFKVTGADNKIMGEAVSNIGPGLSSRISAVHSAPPPRFSKIFLDLSCVAFFVFFCTLVEASRQS